MATMTDQSTTMYDSSPRGWRDHLAAPDVAAPAAAEQITYRDIAPATTVTVDVPMSRPLDKATVTRKRNRKGGTSARVTGVLMPDARMRMALDRDADAILVAGALGLYEPGTVPVVVPAERVDSIGRKRKVRVGDVPEMAYADRWEIAGTDYAAAVDSLAADGMSVAIPFKESFAQVVGLPPVSRRAWSKLTPQERSERIAATGTDCPVARHTADLDPFTASAFDRELLTATRERTAHESKVNWRGRDGYKAPRLPRGWKSGEARGTADDGALKLVGAVHPDRRVWVGHELVKRPTAKRTSERERQARTAYVRAVLVRAAAEVLADRQSRTVDVNGTAVVLAAATKRGQAPTPATRQLYVAYDVAGTVQTASTPAGAARAILARVAAA